MVWFPFVDVVYCAVGKVFVCVDLHSVQGVVGGVVWFGEVLASLGMGGGGRFRSFLGVVDEAVIFGVGVLVRLAYERGVWSGMSSVLMYWCHVWCITVDVGAMSFGSVHFSL